jgi:hypothetical protein
VLLSGKIQRQFFQKGRTPKDIPAEKIRVSVGAAGNIQA